MLNSSRSDIVDFEPIAHSYTNRNTNRRYRGITTFISNFEPEFDQDFWSKYKAIERHLGAKNYRFAMFRDMLREQENKKHAIERYLNNSKDKAILLKIQRDILKEWKDKNDFAKDKGSAFHAKQEDKANYNKYRIFQGVKYPLANVDNYPKSAGNKVNLAYDLPDGVHLELLLVNHQYELAGQCDYAYIETINGIRYVDIDDYKTNEKLTYKNEYQSFLAPLDFLEHHKMNIYRLQILLYAWLFEQCGFVVRRLTLTHTPDEKELPTIYPIFPFQHPQNPIKLMLKTRKKELELLNL